MVMMRLFLESSLMSTKFICGVAGFSSLATLSSKLESLALGGLGYICRSFSGFHKAQQAFCFFMAAYWQTN